MQALTRRESHLIPVHINLLEMVERFAEREFGGIPDDILVKSHGIYTCVYGKYYGFDREEYDCKIVCGEVVAI